MDTFRFTKFPVYQESKQFFYFCLQIARNFSKQYWELSDQLRRAALSVSLNIAEGSAKYSDKDFKRYIENALGSVNEAFACLDIARDQSLLTSSQHERARVMAESIAKQLGGLAKKLRGSTS